MPRDFQAEVDSDGWVALFSTKLKLIEVVTADRRLREADLRTLLSLINHANARTGLAWPSVARLAQKTGLKTRSVQVAISRLAELGYVDRAINAGRGGSNLYTVRWSTNSCAPESLYTPAPLSTGERTTDRHSPASGCANSLHHHSPKLVKERTTELVQGNKADPVIPDRQPIHPADRRLWEAIGVAMNREPGSHRRIAKDVGVTFASFQRWRVHRDSHELNEVQRALLENHPTIQQILQQDTSSKTKSPADR